MAALAAQTSTAPSASATPVAPTSAASLPPGSAAPGTDGASVGVAPGARRLGRLPFPCDVVHREASVGQPGQAVMQSLVQKSLLGLLALGEVRDEQMIDAELCNFM